MRPGKRDGYIKAVTLRTHARSYERLSPQDASFLAFERPNIHMHVGIVAFFEATSFRLPDGGIDVKKMQEMLRPVLTGEERSDLPEKDKSVKS